MIKTRNLCKTYGNFTAVNSINLEVEPGEIYGFLGPNGAGKTSTIMMLLGISKPSSGDIFLFNEKITQKCLDIRHRIGVVPEKHPMGMWNWMTGSEYLALFADIFKVESAGKRIDHLLTKVNLLGVKNKRIKEYSRGMMQKLSIARALLHDPDILFLDEPISGLDPIGIKQVRDLIIEENREGRTIFISSHLLSEMEKLCRRVGIMYNGSLIAEDNMELLLSNLVENREITIDLEIVPENILQKIKEISFVEKVYSKENTLFITVEKNGDHLKVLSKFLIECDLIPLRIQEKEVTLEDAFISITRDNINMFTGKGGAQ